MLDVLAVLLVLVSASRAVSTGFRTVGSSGCAAQMAFVPPRTNTVVFIDNYHDNYGGPGFDVQTGGHSDDLYQYAGSNKSVFGTEFNLDTHGLRPLQPISNTFCSAGQFFPDGTLLNVAGAEADTGVGIPEGFDRLRTYSAGPCDGNCTMDWKELSTKLQTYRWYPSAQTMVDGSVLVVGGSNSGGLVLNEAKINVPTYEIVRQDGSTPHAPVKLPILEFTADENLDPGRSYNLYPNIHLLPNQIAGNQMFTLAGNRSVIWDYTANKLIKTFPDTPLAPRTFPSSATTVLLPLRAPDYTPTILMCGGSSGDIPNPKAMSDCYTINVYDTNAKWLKNDPLPNGSQVMTDGITLPDGTILLINGARHGCAGGYQADTPSFIPLIFDPSQPSGNRFKSLPASKIPRLYHSVALLLPSGEVLVAGSNPAVGYSRDGKVSDGWPKFQNNGHTCALNQQQSNTSQYPTEYRVEIFSPPYMAAATRPKITSIPHTINFGKTFKLGATQSAKALGGVIKVMLIAGGFHTHALAMGQRSIQLTAKAIAGSKSFNVTGPRDASVIPPGQYYLFIVNNGIPSVASWVDVK